MKTAGIEGVGVVGAAVTFTLLDVAVMLPVLGSMLTVPRFPSNESVTVTLVSVTVAAVKSTLCVPVAEKAGVRAVAVLVPIVGLGAAA